MKKFLTKTLTFFALILAAYFIGYFVEKGEEELFSAESFSSLIFIIGSLVIILSYCLPYLKHMFDFSSSSSESGVGKTKDGEKLNQYFDARWISDEELKGSKYRYNTWNTLKNEKKDGIVIRSLEEHGKLNINFAAKTIHTMIIGTTGSGKTTLYINPTIRIFAQMAAKPCMVITDPKGELYNLHSIQLKEAGYKVTVLDLRQPFASTRWNPMDNSYMLAHEASEIPSHIKIHKDGKPEKLKLVGSDFSGYWYELDGVAYDNKEVLDTDVQAKQQILRDKAENELREISATIVTVESKNDASWERGAQDFLYGLMLAMLEDSFDSRTGMTREKFNFYNLAKMANFRDPDPDNPFQTLREYCAIGRDKLSKVNSLTSAVINNAPNTARSYIGVLQGKIGVFSDAGVCYATSANDMDFASFVKEPTVLFIKVPDEMESRHCIATMCISQLYQKLIDIASKTRELELPRPVHFLLDEFANLPKINKMESLITVGRSRHIYFHLVIQSYSQLDSKYGKEAAEIIRGNCNIQIYIGSDDQKTKEDFSKLCGDISMETHTTSTSKNEKRDDGSSRTTNSQIVTRPLIYPYELGQLAPNTVIVKEFQQPPLKTLFTPSYKTSCFDKRMAQDVYVPSHPLDEQKIYFDMKERTLAVGGRKKPSFDDFDF